MGADRERTNPVQDPLQQQKPDDLVKRPLGEEGVTPARDEQDTPAEGEKLQSNPT